MRPYLGSVIALVAACRTDTAPADSQLEAAVVSMFEQGWNRGEVDIFSSTIADTVLFHYAGEPRVVSRDGMAAIVLRWRDAFPDLRMELHEVVAEEELVAARLTLSGTHLGSWAAAAPTGRQVRMALMMLFRFEEEGSSSSGNLTISWGSVANSGWCRSGARCAQGAL